MLTDESAKRHSYDVRLAIETASLLSDDFAIDKERLQRARAEHQSLLDGEIRTAPARKLFEVNAAFHLMLVAFSQNPYFLQITKQQNQLRQVIEYFTHVNRDRMAQSCREHLMIIDALEQGDRYWAASLLERHLKSAKYRLS